MAKTEPEIDEELKKSIAYCNKMVNEGDDLTADFFKMIRRSLYIENGKFNEIWNEYKRNIEDKL